MKLGEAEAVSLWVGPWVLREAERVLNRKSPKSKGYFALLLDRSKVQVGKEPMKLLCARHRLQLPICQMRRWWRKHWQWGWIILYPLTEPIWSEILERQPYRSPLERQEIF
ncbi:MAG: hypothetical protein D6796_03115 [Caldilineae bacterium]|nr:MAG: hypothetical protein D6796_03115 [Caldilineae bacterium]